MKNKLTTDDMKVIADFNQKYKSVIETLNRAQQFKIGDYLVLRVSDYEGRLQVKTNSYGAPVKYKVVYICEVGIAFVKRVNKKGEPIGEIFSCAGTEADGYRDMSQQFVFELDQDFVDSILLEDSYDPGQLHKSKKDIWKAVTTHNKASKVDTKFLRDVIEFTNSANIGDTIWTSNNGFFIVDNKKQMTGADFNKTAKPNLQTKIKYGNINVLTIRDKHGDTKDVAPNFFIGKAIYRDRPRTYKELNI